MGWSSCCVYLFMGARESGRGLHWRPQPMDHLPKTAEKPVRGNTTSDASASRGATSQVIASLSARLAPALRRFFKSRRIPQDDVEDLVQDVFLRLASRPGVESMERLEGYLFTTASNLLRDRHRRMTAQSAETHEPYEESLHGSVQETSGPERALLATQAVVKLVEAMFELPERTRVIFTLYHLEDLSHQNIAQRLGIAVSTIERHMTRANTHLIKRMEGLWK
jgi:RNA polymerase sigma factor (sigma-70 family)